MNESQVKVILLVDDDQESFALFKHVLNLVPGNFDLRTVRDGQAALNYLGDKNNPTPDYVFLDLNMPRMGGLECLTGIRSIRRLRDLPVIVWTMGIRENDLQDAKGMKASAFMVKPSDFDDFYQDLEFILSGPHMPGRYPNHTIEFFAPM
ncbi:MAG: response regulator [Bacteroidetes bacterium]|nr:response regulator [Bacteroidota bacterium]